MKIVLIIILLVGAFVVYLFIEDRRYNEYKFQLKDSVTQKALLLTWETEEQEAFWNQYQSGGFFDFLKRMQDSGTIELVIPLQHKPLQHPDSKGKWTNATIILLNTGIGNVIEIGNQIIQQTKHSQIQQHLRAIDLMVLQNGLDLFYPIQGGKERESSLNLTIEYVFSKPEYRAQYYNDQYLWSGPAMSDLHSRDKAGRFIGFEVKQRLYGLDEMPEWDLFHLVGFTRWQTIKSIPFFLSTWNKHAKRAFGDEMTFTKKLKEWGGIRLNVKSKATQHMKYTLQQKKK